MKREMRNIFKLFGLIIGLASVLWMVLLLIGILLHGYIYFYESNLFILIFELIIVLLAIPILIIMLKNVLNDIEIKALLKSIKEK